MVWAAAVPGMLANSFAVKYGDISPANKKYSEVIKEPYYQKQRPDWYSQEEVGKLMSAAVNEAVAHLAAELAEANQRIEELEVELEIANSEPYGDTSSSPTWHSVNPKKRGMF